MMAQRVPGLSSEMTFLQLLEAKKIRPAAAGDVYTGRV
jgi:hypothetical protein